MNIWLKYFDMPCVNIFFLFIILLYSFCKSNAYTIQADTEMNNEQDLEKGKISFRFWRKRKMAFSIQDKHNCFVDWHMSTLTAGFKF